MKKITKVVFEPNGPNFAKVSAYGEDGEVIDMVYLDNVSAKQIIQHSLATSSVMSGAQWSF